MKLRLSTNRKPPHCNDMIFAPFITTSGRWPCSNNVRSMNWKSKPRPLCATTVVRLSPSTCTNKYSKKCAMHSSPSNTCSSSPNMVWAITSVGICSPVSCWVSMSKKTMLTRLSISSGTNSVSNRSTAWQWGATRRAGRNSVARDGFGSRLKRCTGTKQRCSWGRMALQTLQYRSPHLCAWRASCWYSWWHSSQ